MSRRIHAACGLGAVLLLLFTVSGASANTSTTILRPFAGSHSEAQLVLSESDDGIIGRLEVTVGVGDLRGLYLNVNDPDVLDGLWVSGADVSSFAIGEVIGLGNGSNVNGGGSPCPCDIGIMFGSPGIGQDDIRLTEFLISSDLDVLSVDLFSGLLAGARVTSVGEHAEDGREGSSKLVGVVPEPGTAVLLALGLVGLGIAGRRP